MGDVVIEELAHILKSENTSRSKIIPLKNLILDKCSITPVGIEVLADCMGTSFWMADMPDLPPDVPVLADEGFKRGRHQDKLPTQSASATSDVTSPDGFPPPL